MLQLRGPHLGRRSHSGYEYLIKHETRVMKKLNRKFFERDAEIVAQNLLGKYFMYKTKTGIIEGKIVETEAYGGPDDLASHARFVSSSRNQLMYEQGGTLYVYLVYGIYYLTNIIAGKKGKPSGVLIRSAEIDSASSNKAATGPGKFSQYFKINLSHKGLDIVNSDKIFIEDRGNDISDSDIIKTKRVGVDYAGHSKDWDLRFYIKDNKFISKR